MNGAAVLLAMVLVTGCVAPDGGSATGAALEAMPAPGVVEVGAATKGAPPVSEPARKTSAVTGGGLTVRPAPGYCVDPAAARDTATGAVVLIGRCSDEGRVLPAVISVTIGPAGSARAMEAGGAAIADFVTSDAGRSALSRDGRAANLRVLSAASRGDAFVLRLEERGSGAYWRAVLGLRGRLVAVNVTGAGLAGDDGRRVLEATLTALRQANRTGPTASSPPATDPG